MKAKVEARFVHAAPSDSDPLEQRHKFGLKIDFEREEVIARDYDDDEVALGERIRDALLTTCNALFMATWKEGMKQLNGARGLPRYMWESPPSPVDGLLRRAKTAEKDRDEWRRRAKEAETTGWSKRRSMGKSHTNARASLSAWARPRLSAWALGPDERAYAIAAVGHRPGSASGPFISSAD